MFLAHPSHGYGRDGPGQIIHYGRDGPTKFYDNKWVNLDSNDQQTSVKRLTTCFYRYSHKRARK
jgi:hypothetical protein